MTNFVFSLIAVCGVVSALPMSLNAAEFHDDFKSAESAQRKAQRGDWKFVDGTAQCTQDDELFKKYKDHGPILFYDVPLTDGVIRFRYKPEGCKTVVFTLNGESGHVFRFVASERGTGVRGFPPEGDTKSIALLHDEAKKLADDKWTDVTVTIRGTKAAVKIGDDAPLTVEHESLARPKVNISVGFSFGTFTIADFSVAP